MKYYRIDDSMKFLRKIEKVVYFGLVILSVVMVFFKVV